MRFCDKLPKLRKENNLSQEMLADRLKVSRQAVSKWESGASYPDMDKMIQICDVLNCTLEDLLDDGTIGKDVSTNTKLNLNTYVNDFLKFITSVYNMFCSMGFKQIVKCFLEMAFIFLIILIIGGIGNIIIDDTIIDVIRLIPYAGHNIAMILGTIIEIILIVIGIIIFIHLFKIRYLDYYITVEDKHVKEKQIEEDVNTLKKKEKFALPKKEKVIIRDPKHSTFTFFDALTKIVIIMIKVFMAFIACFVIFSFIVLTIGFFASLYHIQYNIVFLFIATAILGVILFNYDVLEVIYKFIVDKKQSVKKVFFVALSSFILVGLGIGISVCMFINFEQKDFTKSDYKTYEESIKVDDKTLMDCQDVICDYKIDNNRDDVLVQIDYLDGVTSNIHKYDKDYGYKGYVIHYYMSTLDSYKLILDDIKKSRIRNYDEIVKITLITSSDNYNKLKDNYKKYSEFDE